jgi:hypothetical protein
MMGSDDFYNYFGGLVSAVASRAGEMKASFIPNSADRERPELFSLHEEASRIMRARINNPRWIAGLKEHGYKGAQDISEMVDIVFGWDAVAAVIDDWMYEAIACRYVFDEENAGWIRKHNPWAMQNISERLLEAVQRGMWNLVKGTENSYYVSDPDKKIGRHIYGMAVDITIIDRSGRPVPMGTPFDFFGEEAHTDNEPSLLKAGKISPQAYRNRLLLRRVMQQAGFTTVTSEWWHFNACSGEEAIRRYQRIE